MKYLYFKKMMCCVMALLCLGPLLAAAVPFTPGNIVVARVGDGSASLSAVATEVYLDEYTPAGVLVQSIGLPTSVSSTYRILTVSGNATSELGVTRSADGRYLVVAGYSAAPGTPAVATSLSTDVTRVIGRIASDGSYDTSTSTGDAFSGASIRTAATTDGSSFYAVGGNSGVRYVALGGVMSTQLNTAPTNNRYVNTIDGNLYISGASVGYFGLSQVGTGLPTATGQSAAVLPGFPGTVAGSSPYGFYFADLSPTVPGADVVYVADDRTSSSGGIQKWSLVGGSWVLNGTITSTASAALRGLGGSISGTTVSLIATSSNALFAVTDNAGYNAAPSTAAVPGAIAMAPTNTAFRGLAFAPVAPAPTIAGFTPTSGPVGTTVTVTGANLTAASGVTLNGAAVTTFSVVNGTTLTFDVPAGATSGPIAITTPGGTATSTTAFTVTVPNPMPTIASLAPATAIAGSGAFSLTLNGTGFLSSSVVSFNGTALVTTLISPTQLTAAVSAAAVATAGSYPVLVTNPAPGGGASAAATFTVTVPVPTITSFTPASGPVGTTVTVTGTNLAAASSATLNGLAVSAFVALNATSVQFAVPTGATSGPIAVTTPGGIATSTTAFTVTPTIVTPTLASLTPNSQVVNGPAVSVTISGTGFTTASTVNFNGTTYAQTNSTATSLVVMLPAAALTTIGSFPLTVTNTAGTSNALSFSVTAPPAPTIVSFTPTSGGPATTVTVTGSNFMGATSVRIGSFAAANFTVVNSTTITFVLPTGSGSVSGLITVVTPGGTVSSATPFNLVSATMAAPALVGLMVYPNPATDRVTVDLPTIAPAMVTLRDLAGRVVLAPVALGADKQLLLPATLASGIYLLEVRQGAAIAIRRIEKQ